MQLRYILLSVALSLLVACPAEPPTSNQDAGQQDADAAHDNDSDRDADSDVDSGDDTEVDNDADGGADGETDTDPDGDPSLSWDCDPDLPLDDESYANVEDLSDEALRQELHEMIDDHDFKDYSTARLFMFNDLELDDDDLLECRYTGQRIEPDGSTTPGHFNTEHSWPQSQGAGEEPARSDVHHLFPTDSDANSRRGSYEFGNVSCNSSTCDWYGGGSSLGPSADDGRDPVFEVRAVNRGDIARALFYFSVRYEMDLSDAQEAVMREWNCEDPPTERERTRNDEIEGFQGNRNPFVDRPDFVDRIDQF